MSSEISERYAQALFELALEEKKVKDAKEETESLLGIFRENPDLPDFFRAVKITSEEKKQMIEQVFSEAYDRNLINFIKLLIDKGRIGHLEEILKVFVQKANEELGITEATVWSARKLPETDLKRIREALEKKTGKQIVLRNEIDEQLIAGIKVVVGNNVTDVTMKRRIDGMKEALLRGGQV